MTGKLSEKLNEAKKDLEEKIAWFDSNNVATLHILVEAAFCYKKLLDRANLCHITLLNIPDNCKENVDVDLVDKILDPENVSEFKISY